MDKSHRRPDTAQLPVDTESLLCMALRQPLDCSEPDTTSLFIAVSAVVLVLQLPPWHGPPCPCLVGEPGPERKELGGWAGGIQGALLG